MSESYGPIYRALSRAGAVCSNDAKVLLMNILERLGDNEAAWPSQERLAEDLGVSDRTVRRAVTELQALGWLRARRHGQGKPNSYAPALEAVKASLLSGQNFRSRPDNPSREDKSSVLDRPDVGDGSAFLSALEPQIWPTEDPPRKIHHKEDPPDEGAAAADAALPPAVQPDFHQLSMDDRLEIETRWQRERAAFIRRSRRENVGVRDHERLADRKLGATAEDYYAMHAMAVAS